MVKQRGKKAQGSFRKELQDLCSAYSPGLVCGSLLAQGTIMSHSSMSKDQFIAMVSRLWDNWDEAVKDLEKTGVIDGKH